MARRRRTAEGRRRPAHGLEHRGRAGDSQLFAGVDTDERYYFVHSYAVQNWELEVHNPSMRAPKVTWSTHGGPFVAAVENGALWATQFHPEKSGDAGAQLLKNWISVL